MDYSTDEQLDSTLERRSVINRAKVNGCLVAGDSQAGMSGQHHQMVHHGLAIRGLLLLLGADVWRSSQSSHYMLLPLAWFTLL